MTGILEALEQVETAGALLLFDGDKVCIRYQDAKQRDELAQPVGLLRAHREEVKNWLRVRTTIPRMPSGVRLFEWNLKEPPIAIEVCAVVTNPELFARTTLEQLAIALSEPKRWVGWTVPQLVDRLRQVGVEVALDSGSYSRAENGHKR